MGLHRASRKMAKGTGFTQGRTIRLSQLALEIWKWRSESLRGKDPVQEEGCAEIQEKMKSQREAQARAWAALVIEQGPKRQRVSGDFCVSLRPNGIFYTWHPRDFSHNKFFLSLSQGQIMIFLARVTFGFQLSFLH